MDIQHSFEPVQLPNGRFVCFGHEVTNVGVKAVITGYYPEAEFFQLRQPKEGGGFEPGSWLGNPSKCA